MPKSNVALRDLEGEAKDLLQQLGALEVKHWLEDKSQCVQDRPPFESAAEFIASSRQILSRVELFMDAASAPNDESAPAPIKRAIEALFDPDLRERLFELIMADTEQYSKREEPKSGLTYMQHIRGSSRR